MRTTHKTKNPDSSNCQGFENAVPTNHHKGNETMNTLAQKVEIENIPALVEVFDAVIGGISQPVVDARHLHDFLKNGEVFATWIKARIEKYSFIENEDFVSYLEKTKKPQGGRSATNYHLTLDTAKELSMVENNDQGRAARRYFIAMEKQALENIKAKFMINTDDRITLDQRGVLSNIVARRTGKDGALRARMWGQLKNHYGYPASYHALKAIHFDDAVKYLEQMDIGEQKALPAPTQQSYFLSMYQANEFDARLKSLFDLAGLIAKRGDDIAAVFQKQAFDMNKFISTAR